MMPRIANRLYDGFCRSPSIGSITPMEKSTLNQESTTRLPNVVWDTDNTVATENIHATYVVDLNHKTVTYTLTSLEEANVATGGRMLFLCSSRPGNIF